MLQKTKTIKKQKLFYKGLASSFFVCMATLFMFLAWIWGFLARYEAATPEAALKDFTTLVQNQNYDEIFSRGDYMVSEFTTKQAYVEILKKTYPPTAPIHFTKTMPKTGQKRYQAHINEIPVGYICLKEPQITGDPLIAYAEIEANYSVTINAPPFASVYLNDKLLNDEIAPKEKIVEEHLKNLDEEVRPYKYQYKISNLLEKPIVNAKIDNGSTCQVIEENGVINVITLPPEEEKMQFETLLTQVAQTYAAYTSRDASFTDLSKFLIEDTTFFQAMKTFYNGWYIDHESFAYENLQVLNIEQLSENLICGDIKFNYIINQGKNVHNFPSHYKILFLKTDGGYKVQNLFTI